MKVKTLPILEALDLLSLPELSRNLFSSPGWLRIIKKTYDVNLFLKYIERDNGISSYVVYSVVKNFLEWKICICSYCDYFDCFVADKEDWQLYFNSFREEYPEYRIAIRTLRDEQVRQTPYFKVLGKEKFHCLDTRGSLDTLWDRAHESFRSAVKQGQKTGVKIQLCEKKHLKDFYQLHLNLRKNKYHLFPQPYRFFENIWDEFVGEGKGALLGAFDPAGRFIAGNIYLMCGNTLYYKFNTSRLDALKFRPNNVLFWEGIKFAKDRGLEYLDLGSSECDQKGLISFKNHTGAEEKDIVHIGYAPPGYKFSNKIILSNMTRLFTLRWVPDPLVKWGSNWIYPYLA